MLSQWLNLMIILSIKGEGACVMLVLFSLKPKHIQFTVIYGKENCQILAIEKQQSINVGIYLSQTSAYIHTQKNTHRHVTWASQWICFYGNLTNTSQIFTHSFLALDLSASSNIRRMLSVLVCLFFPPAIVYFGSLVLSKFVCRKLTRISLTARCCVEQSWVLTLSGFDTITNTL